MNMHSPRIRTQRVQRRALFGFVLGVGLFGSTLFGTVGRDPVASTALAQEGDDRAPPSDGDRSMGFEAATGPQRENVSGLALMVSAYAIVWAFSMLYLVRMGRLEARLAADVERLERALGPE